MNILVTGANGQLGNEIRLLAPGSAHHFTFTDLPELDITNRDAVAALLDRDGIQVIINCAAYTAVDKAEEEQALCRKVNYEAPLLLAQEAQKRGIALVQISTDYVFDGTAHKPLRESDPVSPLGVYGRTKADCERDVLKACDKTVMIRTAWLYSQFGKNFIKTMLKLTLEKESLGVVFDQIGTPTWAADLAEVILGIIDSGIRPGLYHYSNEGVCSWYDLTVAIARYAGNKGCEIRPLHSEEYPTKAHRPHYSVLDKTLIKETYGIQIPHWQDSLERCLDILLGKEA